MWATILQVDTPACSWCRMASTQHPEVELKVLNYYPRPDGSALELVEMTGPTWTQVVNEIRNVPTVDTVEIVDSSVGGARVRIGATQCVLPAAIGASGVVPQIPFHIVGGCDKWLLLSSKDEAKAFHAKIAAAGINVKLVHSAEYAPSHALTARQQEVLHMAVETGYYDYPRRINLTDLAEKLGVAKSTLSESLAMIESEVVRTADPLAVRARPPAAKPRP